MIRTSVAALVVVAGCGDVYSDIEVEVQATAESVAFTPGLVAPSSLALVTIHARFESAGAAWIDWTSLDGTDGIAMAFPEKGLGFSPGECPENVTTIDDDVLEQVARGGDPLDDQGRYVFCGAIQVGTPTASTVTVDIVFWNGEETVEGSADLAVVEGF